MATGDDDDVTVGTCRREGGHFALISNQWRTETGCWNLHPPPTLATLCLRSGALLNEIRSKVVCQYKSKHSINWYQSELYDYYTFHFFTLNSLKAIGLGCVHQQWIPITSSPTQREGGEERYAITSRERDISTLVLLFLFHFPYRI